MSTTLKRLLTSIASASLLFGLLAVAPATATGTAQNYLVVYTGTSVPSDGASKVKAAGGSIVAKYDKIGSWSRVPTQSTSRPG